MKLFQWVPASVAGALVAFVSLSMLLPRGLLGQEHQRGVVVFWTDKVALVPHATAITPHISIHAATGTTALSQASLLARGITPLKVVPGNAVDGLTNDQILAKWNSFCQDGYVALGFDEFGGWNHPLNARFARLLQKFHETHPDVYIAVWNAGHLDPALARAYRDAANLVMMEVYGHWGIRLVARLTYRIMQVRYFGLVHKTVFGIGIDDAASQKTLASWGRWANSYADLNRQLRWIADFAPDMPGVAFFAPYASNRMLRTADSLAHYYFQAP